MSARYTANIWIATKKDLSNLNSYAGIQSDLLKKKTESRNLSSLFHLSGNSMPDLRSDPGEAAGQQGLKAALALWEAGDTGQGEERWAGLSHGLPGTVGP